MLKNRCFNSTRAEGKTVLEGLKLAWSFGAIKVLECDNQAVVNFVHGNELLINMVPYLLLLRI